MRISKIHYANKFEKQYERLPLNIQLLAEEREEIFRNNPSDARLRTHKLHGREKEARSFSINQKYRIKFIFIRDDEVLFTGIGTHDIYK